MAGTARKVRNLSSQNKPHSATNLPTANSQPFLTVAPESRHTESCRSTRARRGQGSPDLLGFISIFAASVAGFADIGIWAVAACAIALASTSYAEHHALYRRGQELGLTDTLRATVLRSFGNGLIASGAAYFCGWFLRLI